MERGNNKFSALNLNDIYGKKETKPKPSATPTTNGSSGGSHPAGYVLVLSRQKEPSLVAKHDEDKSNSTSSALKKESVENPWAINPFVVSKDSHENEKKAEEHTHANNANPKRETFCSSKPHFPHPGAKKIEGEVRRIPTNIRPRRPSPLRDARNWDDDERSSTLPLHLQENRGTYFSDGRNNNINNHYSGGRYFSDDRNNNMNNHYSGGRYFSDGRNNTMNLSRDYPVQGDERDIDNNNGEREERYGYGMKQNAFHR